MLSTGRIHSRVKIGATIVLFCIFMPKWTLCVTLLFYTVLFLLLEFQSRFWVPKKTPARASVRGLEFDIGLLETEARRLVAVSQPLCPNHHHGRQQR